MTLRSFVGALMVVVGVVLLAAYRDTEFGFVPGWLLGVALLVVGVADLVNGLRQPRE